MSRFFQDYILSVSYIEFDSDVKNLENPLVKNLISRDYRFHSKNEFWAKLILAQTRVETTGGTFRRDVTVHEGFKLDSDLVEKVQRHSDEDIFYIYDGVKGNAEKPAYGHINFQLGNTLKEVKRIYPSILTLF